MTDYKSLAERIRQTLAEGGDCELNTEEWAAVADLLEWQSILVKIRAEIKALSPEPTAYDVVDGNPIKDAVWETLADVLQIIDKYKVESEVGK